MTKNGGRRAREPKNELEGSVFSLPTKEGMKKGDE
jgi:hypothetical protein